MKPLNFYSILFLMLIVHVVKAQDCCNFQRNPWLFGLGINVVNDSGSLLNGIFDIKNNYNYSSPLRISIEKRFKEDYGFEVSANFNTFLKGKTINSEELEEDISFFSLDGMFKYYITNMYQNKDRSWYEGYVMMGGGSSFYDGASAMTANLGGGLNFYISESTSFNMHATAKISVDNSVKGSNYIHYGIGFIIKLEDSYFN